MKARTAAKLAVIGSRYQNKMSRRNIVSVGRTGVRHENSRRKTSLQRLTNLRRPYSAQLRAEKDWLTSQNVWGSDKDAGLFGS